MTEKSRSFWPEMKQNDYGCLATAVFVKKAAKELKEKDKEISSSITAALVPKLWEKYCIFRDRIVENC